VDTSTGQVEILDEVVVTDAGKVIRPQPYFMSTAQQTIFSIGHNMYEDVIYDPATGVKLNNSVLEYKPPLIVDVPPFTNIAIESRLGGGAYGATGNSHMSNVLTLMSAAVFNAIGKWVAPPITPDKVLAALGTIPASSVRQEGSV